MIEGLEWKSSFLRSSMIFPKSGTWHSRLLVWSLFSLSYWQLSFRKRQCGRAHCVALQLLTDLLAPCIIIKCDEMWKKRDMPIGKGVWQRVSWEGRDLAQHCSTSWFWSQTLKIPLLDSHSPILCIFDYLWVKCVLPNLRDWLRRGERARPIASWVSPFLDTNLYAILLKICSGPTPGNREWWVLWASWATPLALGQNACGFDRKKTKHHGQESLSQVAFLCSYAKHNFLGTLHVFAIGFPMPATN